MQKWGKLNTHHGIKDFHHIVDANSKKGINSKFSTSSIYIEYVHHHKRRAMI
jgi:hypothetical protein